MKQTIKRLMDNVEVIEEMSKSFDRTGLDHGSADQTRAMVIESIFADVSSHLYAAIKQLQIIERELY